MSPLEYGATDLTYIGCSKCKRPMRSLPAGEGFTSGVCGALVSATDVCGGLIGNIPWAEHPELRREENA